MGVMDYFKPVSTWTAEKVREFISKKDDGAYNLVDVRQPGEYEKGHLPGARLIPVGQLDERLAELDPGKITIVYCAAGVRSRAAASVLERSGFPEVHSMAGGINAWSGLVAEGFPEAGIPWFSAARSPGELAALAWVLEDGTKTFYDKMAETVADRDAAALFRELVKAEEGYKEMLAGLYRGISGAVGEVDFPSLIGGYPRGKTMEGGMRLDDAVAWAASKGVRKILELSISLETGSYDRYQILQGRADDEECREIFNALAAEEKRHLGLLT
jgi:rhodanese-related sulfurtransferase/rubrerythrin